MKVAADWRNESVPVALLHPIIHDDPPGSHRALCDSVFEGLRRQMDKLSAAAKLTHAR
ncbi:hypothetical protein EMEDMD4_530213 [Sinorhizobium medicae]|uniref:Uncharacterized protein n=1 Tax=Sinorhizobium medicae TaxID=110321 RepID=A0A508X355_9HYPH|nr:hypothetical protein EMEDMD4_530213 [Sinorhizobium medicae]